MMVRADGTDGRVLTTGEGNAGFPSFSPDGTEVVYRYWSDTAGGLRVVSLKDGAVRTLTTGYDNFPAWSPAGDLIVFSRLADGDFDIFSIRPDGTGLRRLTTTPGGDSHPAWSPDGAYILFSSSRHGFKDEAPMHDIPQPYGELFIMRADGSEQRALTDNRWEEGRRRGCRHRRRHRRLDCLTGSRRPAAEARREKLDLVRYLYIRPSKEDPLWAPFPFACPTTSPVACSNWPNAPDAARPSTCSKPSRSTSTTWRTSTSPSSGSSTFARESPRPCRWTK
jgi:hypothetical protein